MEGGKRGEGRERRGRGEGREREGRERGEKERKERGEKEGRKKGERGEGEGREREGRGEGEGRKGEKLEQHNQYKLACKEKRQHEEILHLDSLQKPLQSLRNITRMLEYTKLMSLGSVPVPLLTHQQQNSLCRHWLGTGRASRNLRPLLKEGRGLTTRTRTAIMIP